ncbi:MAG TPA: hypothetical protein DEQ09_09725 [Bacteroidales bacterium]|nr:hypothetical protein [Bacteroidales bacterium]
MCYNRVCFLDDGGGFQIDGQDEKVIHIIDGKTVLSTRSNRSFVFDISHIPSGEYLVLISDSKFTVSKKIIKK